ncbi:MAG: hypothetical protein M1814_004437 [Vezdaea aestivalis]|nr:MAG: hypothetical protein M1814_004437 [Vezdaea aestivalis]
MEALAPLSDRSAGAEASGKLTPKVHETGFTVLVDPSSPSLDIIFVHGFAGHPRNTWTYSGANDAADTNDEPPSKKRRSFKSPFPKRKEQPPSVFWPIDLLPQTTPKARILTYGYDSNIRHPLSGPVNQQTILDLGHNFMTELEAHRRSDPKRRLIFVAHSLGGVVVKEALRKSEGFNQYQTRFHDIYESTTGLIFTGTPHRGSDARSLMRSIAETLGILTGYSKNERLVDGLLPSSERLKELREEFSKMARTKSWEIYSFQEQYGMQALGGKKVVEDESPSLDDATIETKQHIVGDHVQMCRFSTQDDPEYQKLVASFGFLCRRIPKETKGKVEKNFTAEQRRACLDSLGFEQIDSRLINIKNALRNTCNWLAKEPEYCDWLNENLLATHHGLLWIKGNPGVGKSTMMKSNSIELRKKEEAASIISYFFNARGDILERSTIGMYRSIAFQLITSDSELLRLLLPKFVERSKYTKVEWTIGDIQEFLNSVIETEHDKRFIFFIDALDESEENDIRDMIDFFDELSELAIDNGTHLNICFASRHYPSINIRAGKEIILEDRAGHRNDIERCINSKLMQGRRNKEATEIKSEVSRRAKGSFLWVHLVVRSLNKAFDHGQISSVRERLSKTPDELDRLFMDIMTRDNEDVDQLILLLQWLLFARRSLSACELYIVVQSVKDQRAKSSWFQARVSDDDIEKFIVSCSKGLAQVSKTKDKSVQLIHESVREFLLRNNGLSRFRPDLSCSFLGKCHETLRKGCHEYLATVKLQEIIASWLPQPASNHPWDIFCMYSSYISDRKYGGKHDHRYQLLQKFPFVSYAMKYVFEHADMSEKDGISQEPFLRLLDSSDQYGIITWIELWNFFESFKIRLYRIDIDLVYLFSERGLPNLLRLALKSECANVNAIRNGRYERPLLAACTQGHTQIVEILLAAGADLSLPSDQYTDAISAAIDRNNLHIARVLIGSVSSASTLQYGKPSCTIFHAL